MYDMRARSAVMLGLAKHMTGMRVRVGSVVADGDMGFSCITVLQKFNCMTYSAASQYIINHKASDEFNNIIKPTRFLRSDGAHYICDGVTLEGIYRLMLILPGSGAIAFRTENSDVFIRHLGNDETLQLEGVLHQQSNDPMKLALRERILAKNAAAAALAAPMIEPIIEPVAAPIIEPVAAPAAVTVAPAACFHFLRFKKFFEIQKSRKI